MIQFYVNTFYGIYVMMSKFFELFSARPWQNLVKDPMQNHPQVRRFHLQID